MTRLNFLYGITKPAQAFNKRAHFKHFDHFVASKNY